SERRRPDAGRGADGLGRESRSSSEVPYVREYAVAEELHAAADRRVREIADLHREIEDAVAERGVDAADLLDHARGAAAQHHAARDLLVERSGLALREAVLHARAVRLVLVVARL